MRPMTLCIAVFGLLFWAGCEDRRVVEEPTIYRETALATAPADVPPTRQEGPAERTGRVVDDALDRAAETVGRGLEEAGREIRENVPEPGRR